MKALHAVYGRKNLDLQRAKQWTDDLLAVSWVLLPSQMNRPRQQTYPRPCTCTDRNAL